MSVPTTHFGFPRHRLRTPAFAAALVLITAVGCWQEIRYDPNQEPSEPPVRPVVSSSETPQEQPAPAPSAEQLFAEDTPEAPVEEEQHQEDPLWNGMETETAAATPAEPAPPAEIEWPGDQPVEEQPEIAAVPTPADPRTALATWRMASKWSLAVGVYGKGWPAERYADMWQQAEFAAQLLRVQLPPLPEDVAEDEVLIAATSLLLEESGPQLAEAVAAEHSPSHRALCDLAVKTHALLLIYTPNGSDLEPLVTAIRQAAQDSPLPERLWAPVLQSVDAGSDFQEVKRAVFELHDQATEYLGDLVSP